ncbi:MAG: hypothetical protein NT103_09790 [Campylobacterales bacterium]|nr:hypothetical protein [Campylobacterales bacterium]
MKKTVKYSDEPIVDLKIIADFLPPLNDLIFKDDTVKITISLTKESVEFFKKEAEKHHTQSIGCVCDQSSGKIAKQLLHFV